MKRPPVDLVRLEVAARELLLAAGYDPESEEGIRDTPKRMALAYEELLTPKPFQATSFANEEGYDEMVMLRDIPVTSLCEHHMLPWIGVAHVAYIPGEQLIGLSKLGRVVEMYAHGLQLQERLTTQVADWLEEELAPKGVGVVVQAEHMCMSIRGLARPGTSTITSAVRGKIRSDVRTRQEFLSLTGVRSLCD